MTYIADILSQRRIELGMSTAVLARRSGVSLPTVHRVLSGSAQASVANIESIAGALGLRLKLESVEQPELLREKQAEKKAIDIVRMVQGTSGLEGQAVDRHVVKQMIRRTIHELLAGSERKLWAD